MTEYKQDPKTSDNRKIRLLLNAISNGMYANFDNSEKIQLYTLDPFERLVNVNIPSRYIAPSFEKVSTIQMNALYNARCAQFGLSERKSLEIQTEKSQFSNAKVLKTEDIGDPFSYTNQLFEKMKLYDQQNGTNKAEVFKNQVKFSAVAIVEGLAANNSFNKDILEDVVFVLTTNESIEQLGFDLSDWAKKHGIVPAHEQLKQYQAQPEA